MKIKNLGMLLLVLVSVMIATFILVGVKDGSSAGNTGDNMILKIKIHKIQKIDKIESVLEDGADWYYKIYVYDGSWQNTSDIYAPKDTDNPIIDRTFEFHIHSKEIAFYIKLMESDFWSNDDLADISSYAGGGKDNNVSYDRGAIFMAHYNIENNSLWGDKVDILIEINHNYSESYYYTSGSMDGSNYTDENDASLSFQIWHENETMHYSPDEIPFTIIQITDIHISATDNRSWDDLERVIKDINIIHPNLVLATGDLVGGATNENYQKFNQIISDISPDIDVKYIVGNHDIRVGGSPFEHDYAWYHYYISLKSDRIVVDKYSKYGYVLLGLDSNDKFPILNDFTGELNKTQLDWLHEKLNYYNTSKQIIIFMHHPIFAEDNPTWGDPTISDNMTAKDKFIDYCEQQDKNGYSRVSLVLTGHVHIDGIWEENGKDESGHYPQIGKKLIPMETGYYNNFNDKKTKFIHTASVIGNRAYKVIQLYGENAVYRTYVAPSPNPLPSIENITVFPSSVVNRGDKVFVYATINGGKSGIKVVKCFWSEDKMSWNPIAMEEIGNGTYTTTTSINTSYIPYGAKIFCKVVAENKDNYLAISAENFSVNIPPVANFSWNPLNPKVLDIIQFIDNSHDEDGMIINYTWNFGDGNISHERNPKHSYSNYGVYTVTLTVKDDGEAIASISKEIMMELQPLPNNYNPPTDPDNDGLYEDINGNGLTDFDDIVEFFQHFEWIEKNYPMEILDFNENGLIDFDDIVELFRELNKTGNQPPSCSLHASPSSGYAPLVVTFSLSASDKDGYIASWKLDVNGDGVIDYHGNGKPPSTISYTYQNAGTYVANLTVEDNNGSFAYDTATIIVYEQENQLPHADFTYSINNLTVTFTDLSYDNDGYIASWQWDFGDGITSNERNPIHTYLNYGTYSIMLTVTDNKGASDTKTVSITLQQQHEEWNPQYGIKYEVHVTNVVDGDTFDATFPNGSIERVRLLGIDCPEKIASNNKPNEYDSITNLTCLAYWGMQARYFAENWLGEKDVYIEFDSTAGFKGYYGRWLCYVYTQNNTDFNAELVEKGLARVYTEGECSKENYYLTLQQQAMDNKTGLWSCMPQQESGGVVISYVHYDAAGNDWYNLNDEYVVIKNEENESVDMTGWSLSDEANHVYTFPSFVLNANATVTVYTGSGTNTQDKLYWGSNSPIWNNDHDTAYLKDARKLVDSWGW